MTWLGGYRMMVSLLGVVAAIVLGPGSAKADFTLGEPVRFDSVYVIPSDDIVCFSSDGLEMYIDRYLSVDNVDLYVLKRATVDDDWGPAVSLGPAVNSPQKDWIASISTSALALYFQSNRPGGHGATDIYMTTRTSRNDPWGPPVNLGPTINSSSTDADVSISADGLELYFMSDRSGGYGGFDLYVSRRATTNDPWGAPVNLGPAVNSAYNEGGSWLSPEGLLLLLQDNGGPRPGGYGNSDFWMSRRASLFDSWQTPVNLGPRVNGPGMECLPRISPDGRTLCFCGTRSGDWDVWQAPVIPIVDFNGDQLVDITDLLRLIESWGEDDPSVDIGPMPWGDGKVDAKDLEVLMSYWGQEVNDPRLVASWGLDETEGIIAVDKAGTHHGTLIGNPMWQPAGGKINGALQFDGIDDYVSTAFVVNPSEGPFSVFAWVKGGAPGQAIISQLGGVNWLMLDPTTGALQTELRSTGRFGKGLTSDTIITDGDWHRIGLTWGGSNRRLYVDDVPVAEDTQSGLMGSSGKMLIGCGKDMARSSFWSGLIDDVRVYNRAVQP
jgi:hypothetical protein